MAWYAQETDHTCGPAALRTAADLLGQAVPDEDWLVGHLGTDTDGTRPARMAAGADALGLTGPAAPGHDLDDLRRALLARRVPLVLYTLPDEGVDHYAIVREVTKRRVVLADPWYGPRRVMPTERFQQDWRAVEHDAHGWALELARA